jgi:hypothetical protein
MANVYDLGSSFDLIWNLIEEDVMEESALDEAFDNLVDDTKDKFENCCKYIKNVDADIKGLDEEIKRLQAKKKSLVNGKERLKALMLRVLQKMGEKKLPCGTFTVSRQNNPESLVLDEPYIENIPEKFLKPKDPDIDRTAMKEILQHGSDEQKKELEGIAHLEQDEGLRIR